MCGRMPPNTRRHFRALSTMGRSPVMPALFLALISVFLGLAWKLTRRQSATQTGHEQASKMAADPVSSLFPNRPIRPLPKRRLRERLSPEVADSIQYPPLPQTMAPLFPYPYPLIEENTDPAFALARADNSYIEPRQHQNTGLGIGGHGDRLVLKGGAGSRAITEPSTLGARAKLDHARYGDSLPILSVTPSADGYDPFENTNNKKRKIPTVGDSAPSGAHLINDSSVGMNPMATTQAAEGNGETAVSASSPYYGSGSLASGLQNVPGPGRGRFGRPRSGKSTTRPLADSTNSWAGRSSKPRPSQYPNGSSESTGIISTAIANAEKLPPHQGQENISLLHQQLSAKRSPASTQFTFTCNSQVPGSLAWPGADRRVSAQVHQASSAPQGKENWPHAPQATQAGQAPPATVQTAEMGHKESPTRSVGNAQSQPTTAPKSSRRSLVKEYMAAARARRRETQLQNRRKPPKPEDIWICEFCEYEAIFGHPPEALVRQYEEKDRKQRQLKEQRQAQWERMKKGKHKGRKNSKLPAKGSHASQDSHHGVDGRDGPGNHYDHGAQDEDYYEDEYYEDEDYDPDDEIPPLEASPTTPSRHDEGVIHSSRGGYTVHDGGGT